MTGLPSSKGKEDVVWALARNVVQTEYQNLPSEAVESTKKSILDTLGVIEAASGITPGLKELVELVTEGGGKKESTILGFGSRVPAWMAAFANGAMAHCLDYDDLHHRAKAHLSATTVPSGFAIAERLGKVKGKDFVTAVALGNDLMARLCCSISLKFMWHRTPLFGVFAAAATSGKLLRLNEEQMVDALGLAFCQAAGTMEQRFSVGSEIGGMRDAFPNKGGVLAALMAKSGIRGVRSCFEGKAGLFNVYFGGEYDREALTTNLGKKFHGADIGFKPWPACGSTHSYIDTTLALVSENDIHPENIEEITVFVGESAQTLCQPLEARRKPVTTLDAKYSIPFTVSVGAARGKVVLKDYFAESLRDPVVLALAQKVTPKFDAECNAGREHRTAQVDMRMKNGKVYSKRIDLPYGHPDRPMSWESIVNKFRDCLSHAAKPVPKDNMEKVIDMVGKLEEVEDVSKIVRLLA